MKRFISTRRVFAYATAIAMVVGPTGSAFAVNTKSDYKKPNEQSPVRWQYTPEEITAICDAQLARLDFSNGAQLPKDAFVLDQLLTNVSDGVTPVVFMAYVHEDQKVRDAASACEENQGKTNVQVFARRDLYEKVKATAAKTAEQKKLVSEFTKSFEKNGMALSDADLQALTKLKSELTELETQFSKNLVDDKSSVELTTEELAGVSPDVVETMKKSDSGNFIATTKNNHYFAIMENGTDERARRKMMVAYEGRGGDKNIDLMKRALAIRTQIAKMLKYETWADHQTDGRMAKNAKTAMGLIVGLKEKLKPRLNKDMSDLLEIKKATQKDSNATLQPWDIRFYSEQLKKTKLNVDNEVIKEYFPKDRVVAGMFKIYQQLLGVEYKQVSDANVWNKEVTLYSVHEKGRPETIAYFYMDMVPRYGKYGHAAAFSLLSGFRLNNRGYSVPVSSIVANFTAPTADKPSLLSFDEVETLFHEFGHIMHQVLTRAPYGSLSGTAVARDFVEAPSQMLENWVWDRGTLQSISGHYQDAAKKLPESEITKLLAAKDFNIGYFYSRQIVLGLTDLTLHTSQEALEPQQVYAQVSTDVLGVAPIEGSKWIAGFGHLMGGYDAGYYGYIWSEVYAADMFTRFEKTGLLSAKSGKSYRKNILEPGNMDDALNLVEKFLGRKSNNQAFLKKLGIE
jgi:thimet oligopeptidase